MIPKEIQRALAPNGDGHFELAMATTIENGQKRFAYAQLELVRQNFQIPRPEADLSYEELHLRRSEMAIDVAEKLLGELYGGQQVSHSELAPFSPMTGQNPATQLLASRAPYYGYSRLWPLYYTEFRVPDRTKSTPVGRRLVGRNLPFYPSGGQAIQDFFALGSGTNSVFSNYGILGVVVPDYRGRIDEFVIGYQRLSLKVVAGEEDLGDLQCMIYAENETKSANSGELALEGGEASFSVTFDPSHVVAVLVDKEDSSVVDQRDWFPGYVHPDYVKTERPEQQIRDLILAGEGKHIEFKGALDDKEDFLETVVAFTNSEGGLILLGINNNRVPRGYKGDEEGIAKMIRDSCEPLIEPTFKSYELDGYLTLAVEIAPGNNKPYMMKHKGVVYVRVGPNDVPATRSDLDALLKQQTGNPFSGNVLR